MMATDDTGTDLWTVVGTWEELEGGEETMELCGRENVYGPVPRWSATTTLGRCNGGT